MKRYTLLVSMIVSVVLSHPVMAQIVGTISVGDVVYSASENKFRTSESLVSSMMLGLNKGLKESRKFNVLSRTELNERLEDQGRTLKGYYDKAYVNDPYEQVGLDYIVRVDVIDFDVSKQASREFETATASIGLNLTLYGVADATQDRTDSVSAQVSTKIELNNNVQLQNVVDASVQQTVNQLVDKIIAKLFPIRVMRLSKEDEVEEGEVEEDEVTLNYGDGLLAVGDIIKVAPEGINIELDNAGQPVGESIATLRVVSSGRKFSKAQVLNGLELLKKGQQGALIRGDVSKPDSFLLQN